MSIDIKETTIKILENVNGQSPAYSTGFYDLDSALQGFQKSQMTLLAGRHSMGKTAFALNIASNLAKNGHKVLFISCEMNDEILMKRLIAAEAEIDMNKLYEGVLSKTDFEKISKRLNSDDFLTLKNNLVLESSFTDKFDKLTEIINDFVNSNPEGMVIIDYFQLLNRQGLAQDRYVELADLASSIKRLAVKNNIHLILLSQISRKVEERNNKRPLVSDLSECDALSQHADNIIFINRNEYWDKENFENRGKTEIFIDKIKNHSPKEFELLFQANIMKFKQPIRVDCF